MKQIGTVSSLDNANNGFWIRREDESDIFASNPRPQRNHRGPRFQARIGDVVEFNEQPSNVGVEAVDVVILQPPQTVELSWTIEVLDEETATEGRRLAVSPLIKRGRQVPAGLIVTLKSHEALAFDSQEELTDGTSPAYFEVLLEKGVSRCVFRITIRERGKIPQTFRHGWQPIKKVAKYLKITHIGDSFYHVATKTDEKGEGIGANVLAKSTKPIDLKFLGNQSDKPSLISSFATASNGNADIVIELPEGQKSSQIMFCLEDDETIVQGPFVIKAEDKSVNLKVVEAVSDALWKLFLVKTINSENIQTKSPFRIQTVHGSTIAVRVAGQPQWKKGTVIDLESDGYAVVQVQLVEIADGLAGDEITFLIPGTTQTQGSFYIPDVFLFGSWEEVEESQLGPTIN